jgi:ADP-ribosylglycohydrolase
MSVTITLEQWELSQRLQKELDALPAASAPPPAWRSSGPTRQSSLGMVLGAAIGDALGHPTEFLRSPEQRLARLGVPRVDGYFLWWERAGRRFAPYTDDTQLAEAVLRGLLWSQSARASLEQTMDHLGKRFVVWAFAPQGGHRAPGNATLAGCRLLAEGIPWREAGGADAGGCGSVMRAYPFGLVFGSDPEQAERWAVEHSRLTHGAPIALAACAAMAVGAALVLRGEAVGAVLAAMVAAAGRWDEGTAAMIQDAWDEAVRGVGPEVTLGRLAGWAAHEAIAAGAYLLARHPDDYRAAVLEGANAPGDSDSIATIAGALVGGRLGAWAIPPEWVRDLERTGELTALAESAVPAV